MIDLHLGKCEDVLATLPPKSVDLIIADPPYEIKNINGGGNNDLSKTFNKYLSELDEADIRSGIDESVLDLFVSMQNKINMYFFCNKAQIPFYIHYFVDKLGCSMDIIKWVKTNPVPAFNNKYMTDTEYCLYFRKGGYCNPQSYEDGSTLYLAPINTEDKIKYGHPTPKPVPLLERLVRNSSKPGNIILDPYMGSGSTGEACIKNDRKFIGIELNKTFFDTAKNRLSKVKKNGGILKWVIK